MPQKKAEGVENPVPLLFLYNRGLYCTPPPLAFGVYFCFLTALT